MPPQPDKTYTPRGGKSRAAKWRARLYSRFPALWREEKAKNREVTRDYRKRLKANAAKYREYRKKENNKARYKKYRLRPDEYARLLAQQRYRCATCRTLDPGRRGAWPVDHDPNTNLVRGILCHSCNLALGHVKHDVRVLERMIEYLIISGRNGSPRVGARRR